METTRPTVSIKKHLQTITYKFTPLTHNEICERIEAARTRHSFNKAEFCQMMGYNPTILNKWLKGANFSSKSYRSAMELIKKLDEAPKQTEIKFNPKPIEKPNYGVLTLEAAIKMVKDAGYKVSKRVETWEEI
jgi:transcriptional regulator with XRE-family HTH domain